MYFKKAVLQVALSILIVNISFAQKIDPIFFSSLRNEKSLPYKLKNGDFIGCAHKLECRTMKVVFYGIVLNLESNKIKMWGRILEPAPPDSVGATGVAIFLARPKLDKLTSIRYIDSSSSGKGTPRTSVFLDRIGDFSFETHFSENDYLYFVGQLYDPEEFAIGRLLKTDTENRGSSKQ